MNAIKIIRGCGASGQSLQAGRVYAVPGEVSERDAHLLVQIGKAEAHADTQPVKEAAREPAREMAEKKTGKKGK